MLQLTLVLAIIALAVAIGTVILLWQRGAFAGIIVTTPPVEMPVVVLTGDLDASSKCGENTFRGTAELDLIYLPAPRPNAEVKVTLKVQRSRNVSVTLRSTDLGIFRNDVTKSVAFEGELVDPCADGDFTLLATVVNQGPDALTITDGARMGVDALDYVVSMPHQVSTSDGIRFTLDVTVKCCGAAARERIFFSRRSGVRNLRATPRSFTCGGAGAQETITVTGEKEDANQVGVFTVNARSAFGGCVLGSVQVE